MFIIDNPQLCLYSFINPDAIYFTLILNQNRQGQAYKCKLVLNYDLLNNLPEGKSQNHSIFSTPFTFAYTYIKTVCSQNAYFLGRENFQKHKSDFSTFQFQPEIVTARNAKDTKD
jgi:hypothetical protein